jgi:DNA-binding IclR family transcriptional regulator
VLLATYDNERLGRFLHEPLVRFTPSTITTAEALRSELDRVHEQRYAFVVDEEEEGLSSIGVGVNGQTDELLGVVCVSGPTQRLDRLRGRHAVDHLLRASAQIESVLRRGRQSSSALDGIAQTGG